jgi:hypothetical protein
MLKFILIAIITISISLPSFAQDDDKKQITLNIWGVLKPPLETGEFYRGAIPILNDYNAKNGKPLVTFDEVKPKVAAIGPQIFNIYIDPIADVFTLEELNYQKKLFETKIGNKLLVFMVEKMTNSNTQNQLDLESFPESDKNEFTNLVNANIDLTNKINKKMALVNEIAMSKAKSLIILDK